MASQLKRIEKEFILGIVRDKKVKILLLAGNGEWPVEIQSFSEEFMVFTHALPPRLLRRGIRYEFRFVCNDQTMAFRSRTQEVKEATLTVDYPEHLYRNLDRRYSRRPPPSELSIAFSFKGERYQLSYPTTPGFTSLLAPEPSSEFEPKDIRDLMRDFYTKAEAYATDRAIIMFKDRSPETLEERAITGTGKILYIPAVAGGLPSNDPFKPPLIITKSAMTDFFRSEGVPADLAGDELDSFEKKKRESGILSELMVPILFQDYVIGYTTMANKTPGRMPFDTGTVKTFNTFARVLAWSLLTNGYFKGAPKKNASIKAQVLDVSAGGILFTCESTESGERDAELLPDTRLDIDFKIGARAFVACAVIKRSYGDGERRYYGIEYDEFKPEDFRFLFEALYGRPFTDADGISIEGLAARKGPIDFTKS
ncbi:MAG: hypothetical protein WCQ50_07095 [Spirochaetota bacterium]